MGSPEKKGRNNQVIADYESGLSTYEVGLRHSISSVVAFKILKRNGVVLRNMKDANILRWKKSGYDQERQDKEIFDMYESGLSVGEIKDKCGYRSDLPVYMALKRMEVIYREQDRSRFRIPIHDFWFTESAEKYYLLGFLFADGNVSQDGNVTVSSNDIDHLGALSKLIDKKVRISKNGSGILDVGRKNLAEYLLQYGLVPAKSNIMKFPVNIPDQYIRDFIRGEFDGDGYISVTKDHRVSFGFSCGSVDFLVSLQAILQGANIGPGVIRDQKTAWGSVFQLYYGGVMRAVLMREFIYYPESFCLYRKYEKFEPFVMPVQKVSEAGTLYWTKG